MSEVLIVAAEASSSLYAQRLLEHWKTSAPEVRAFGIGSVAMENAGFEIIGRSEELAVVGLQEVIAHWSVIKSTFDRLLVEAARRKPKFALLLDYPDFNLRLAAKLKAQGIQVIYYISPQVWAWRTGRIKLIKRVVDRMLVLFPFEEKFYKDHGVTVDFVGHPLLDEISDGLLDPQQIRMRRERYGIPEKNVVLGLMPGSRRSEIKHHLAVQLRTAELLADKIKNLHVSLLIAPTLDREQMRKELTKSKIPIQIIKAEPFEMISLCDAILCASGTATLMVGLMEKPMVIMYKMNPLTAFMAKRLVTQTPFFGMVNLIMNSRVVPELFQEQTDPKNMAKQLLPYLIDQPARQSTIQSLKDLKNRLGARGATDRVTEILRPYL